VKRTAVALALVAGSLGTAWGATEGPSPGEKVPYVVRYLVFQHQGYWDDPLDAPGPDPEAAVTYDTAGSRDKGTASGSDPMASLWRKLSESSRYRPLLRGLAVPFAKPRDEAEPITIDQRWTASIRPPFDAMANLADRPIRLAMGADWAPPEVDGDWGSDRVRGHLVFYKGRYAHLAVDLTFTEAQRWMPWGLDVRHHFMRQSRRLLPNRFYYFDHPRFGVITRIEPMGE
jgi:hypothetical protein